MPTRKTCATTAQDLREPCAVERDPDTYANLVRAYADTVEEMLWHDACGSLHTGVAPVFHTQEQWH
ncbi:MAG: hypothetical protein GC164_05490 [Phycisphaera sp.]|nr:hypothetical protein [Phycisphaera sp.]